MANLFNFETEKTEREVPSLIGSRKFAPLVAHRSETIVILVLVGILTVLLIMRKIHSLRDLRAQREAMWEHIREACLARGLNEDSVGKLLRSLRRLRLRYPHRAVTSPRAYDGTVAKQIERDHGPGFSRQVRQLLFQTTILRQGDLNLDAFLPPSPPSPSAAPRKPSAPEAGETPESEADLPDLLSAPGGSELFIAAGDVVKARFARSPRFSPCPVLFSTDRDFVIALPEEMQTQSVVPEAGERVVIHVAQGEAYLAFETAVREIIGGGVQACRLAHYDALEPVERRNSDRVRLDIPLHFFHFTSDVFSGAGQTDGRLETAMKVIRKGILRDISPGGCAIETRPDTPEIESGHFLRFRLTLAKEEEPSPVLGRILRVDPPQTPETRLLLHIQFLGMAEDEHARLMELVHILRSKQKSR